MKQSASVIASTPATIRRPVPTAAGGSFQSVAFQLVIVITLVTSVQPIQTADSVLSSAAAVVAARPAARAQRRGVGYVAAVELAGREQFRAVSSMPIQAAVASGWSAMA